MTLRRSDTLDRPRSPPSPQREETSLQDTNTALTRQLELAHATIQPRQTQAILSHSRSHSGSAGSSFRERNAPDRHCSSRSRHCLSHSRHCSSSSCKRRAARVADDRARNFARTNAGRSAAKKASVKGRRTGQIESASQNSWHPSNLRLEAAHSTA